MQCKNICTPRCRCVLRLPDGSTVTSTVGGDTGGSKVSLTESQSPSHGRLPLPTITEQVIMNARAREKHNKVRFHL